MPSPSASSFRHDDDYPLVGETLGLWRLVRGLGKGGMGEVYEGQYDFINLLILRYPAEQRSVVEREVNALSRAEQARLASDMLGTQLSPEARFAIKICSARSGTAGHKRFLQEAELAQRLGDHPYIVTVHALNIGSLNLPGADLEKFALERGKYRDVAFMVMDLAARDYDHTKLSPAQAVHVVRCIAIALDHAHSRGIVHRDLKPENLLGTIEHTMLTDFGIAKELDQSDGLTRTGQVIGTLDYMSPEQATDAKRVDHRSDIYSLGVVLYEMATQGCLPYFHKADRESCLHAIRTEMIEPKWPREYVKDFPIGLERIVLKATAFRPEHRYQAMSELVGDLDRWTRGDWISPVGRIRMSSWVRYQRRHNPKLVYGGATAVILGVIMMLIMMVSPLLDTQRRKLDQQLNHLAAMVDRVEAGSLSQLGKDDQDKLSEVDAALRLVSKDYPAHVERRDALRVRLLQHRWLSARFAGDPQITGPDAASAREQLIIATGARSPDWTLEDGRGLVIHEDTQILLGPYGAGGVHIRIEAVTADGFKLEVCDGEKLVRHRHLWRIVDGRLQQYYRMDERSGMLLGEGAIVAPMIIDVDILPDEVRVTEPRAARHRIQGLSEGAPVWLELNLPKGSALRMLEVRPLR